MGPNVRGVLGDEAKRDETLVMFFPIAPRYLQGPKRGCVSSTAQRFQNYDWLVVLTILKNMKVSWERIFHMLWKHKKCSKPPFLHFNFAPLWSSESGPL